MVKNIAYGSENGKYYVQSCCNEEHKGQECDCRTYGENLTKEEAISLANKKGEELNVSVVCWDK